MKFFQEVNKRHIYHKDHNLIELFINKQQSFLKLGKFESMQAATAKEDIPTNFVMPEGESMWIKRSGKILDLILEAINKFSLLYVYVF